MHCESKVSCPRTQHNVSGCRSLDSEASALTMKPLYLLNARVDPHKKNLSYAEVINILGSFRFEYEYEIEYQYDFSIAVFRLHIITTHANFILWATLST